MNIVNGDGNVMKRYYSRQITCKKCGTKFPARLKYCGWCNHMEMFGEKYAEERRIQREVDKIIEECLYQKGA